MSFYIELKNYNGTDQHKTFLVSEFTAAAKYIDSKSVFKPNTQVADPDNTVVTLRQGGFRDGGTTVEIPLGYDDFKDTLLLAKAKNEIASFGSYKYKAYGG